MRCFLGLVGFNARFIPDFSATADLLRKIARQGESFIWGEEQEKSFQPFNYQVCYVSSRKNIADALSRLTKIVASNQSQDDDEYVRMVALHAAPATLKMKETERVSAEDPELQAVRRCLVEDRWNSAPKQYLPVRNELTFIGHVILRGTRIVMPQALRKRVVSLSHEGHQGGKDESQDESLVAGGCL